MNHFSAKIGKLVYNVALVKHVYSFIKKDCEYHLNNHKLSHLTYHILHIYSYYYLGAFINGCFLMITKVCSDVIPYLLSTEESQ